jgi:hypothetical protein
LVLLFNQIKQNKGDGKKMPRIYDYQFDPADERDHQFVSHLAAPPPAPDALPDVVDLRPLMSPVVNQENLGSCTANALVSGYREYLLLKSGFPFVNLSRLFLYWEERTLEGTVDRDAGAYLRDGMKQLQQVGVAPESDFPYITSTFTQTPTDQAIKDAARFSITNYFSIQDFHGILVSLSQGFPVALGIRVYESFESPAASATGIIPMPNTATEQLLGGHAVLAVGYKTINGILYVICRNSWGTDWGDQGYFYLPQEYFSWYVPDRWTATDKFTTPQAIDVMAAKGILQSPDFWHPLVAKYDSIPGSDFRYVGEAFQNIASFLRYMYGSVTISTNNDFLSNPTISEAVDFLASKGILKSPDFWHALVDKYINDPTSDLRYVGKAFQNTMAFIQSQG